MEWPLESIYGKEPQTMDDAAHQIACLAGLANAAFVHLRTLQSYSVAKFCQATPTAPVEEDNRDDL